MENYLIFKTFVVYYTKLALERSKSKKNLFEKNSHVFLDELLKEIQEPTVLLDQAIRLLIYGRDTTSAALRFIFYQFTLHKNALIKIRNEILNAFGTSNENMTF